ncbi:hypothetical protein LEP1GSC021_0784 [Leptospira noguchii str. 1993005606]|uniref:Uncharacterized protein n=2 Tax=Leptospira noguchii TaxID=28182 RepID=M6UW90_9LEPT|nr:hypothetical protein LEP1GSC041_4091 [Leptospira noguchii str. 2006001870]EMI72361.1 hypothetical protein LEP1GSC072_3876 [Leptospira noguchii str. Bonito]EMM98644.1 hypothetical protein LEP1GSC035_0935 [Leptospira noguchii str. 2007001578]EMO41543.1 hypothetical protein LEP1GSC186_1938 [Leptospira noguchii serovar Autumnalis str. ZUN142]EMS85146.1 hypothetical protein LEP1GSC073_2917 [Leptospira noguchii str. Cascata]EMS88931.1 hypothetical protein LEP1GSC074_2638 [Leptospira noguchii str.
MSLSTYAILVAIGFDSPGSIRPGRLKNRFQVQFSNHPLDGKSFSDGVDSIL